MKPRLCVDFDGTITPDGCTIFPGCIETLNVLRRDFIVSIFSARETDAERQQMKEILDLNRVPYDEILDRKPVAAYYIDDKGIKFEGWEKLLALKIC